MSRRVLVATMLRFILCRNAIARGQPLLSASLDFSRFIPIFPLPNAVLMPCAVLPLHIFEQRYRDMTEHALAKQKLIAIALLKPGYEAEYETLTVAVHERLGVGRIIRAERLPDGRFNILLQGVSRAQIMSENTDMSFRRGLLKPVDPIHASPEVEQRLLNRIQRALQAAPLLDLAREANWLEMLECPDFELSDVVDVLASAALPNCPTKQEFLDEPCTATRAICMCDYLTALASELEKRQSTSRCPRSWPPGCCDN